MFPEEATFKALADSSRRAILDLLFVGDGQTTQQLCDQFPAMTRFGVMKHLAILEEANLLTTRKEGRTKQHFLNPLPIQEIADRWIGKYAQPFARALLDLKRVAESQPISAATEPLKRTVNN